MTLLRALRDCSALDGLDQRFAETLGRLGGVTDQRVLAAAGLADRAPRMGHTRIELSEAATLLRAELGPEALLPELPETDAWWRAIREARALVRDADEARATPLVAWDGALYLDRYWDYENRLARAVLDRVSGPPLPVDEVWLAAALARRFPAEDPRVDLQRQAAEAAVRRRLVVVTGGPGTGKTSVVVELLAILGEQAARAGSAPPRVVLAAPTGKAAARMREAVGIEASTLHRALGMRMGSPTPGRDERATLRADVVVVDEASMVPLPMMTKLLEAVPPHARVILLGDPDQLESVEVGSVLADLCAASGTNASLAGAHIALQHTWRYPPESGIATLARAIRGGDADAAISALSTSPELEWVAAPPEDADGRQELVARVLKEGYAGLSSAGDPAAALAWAARFRVLCAHREGPFGLGEVHDVAAAIFGGPSLRHGMPLMITVNDRRLGVSNGDSGIVLADPTAGGALRLFLADGRGGWRALRPALLSGCEPAYASTVHKSQGSEFDTVAVFLPTMASPLLTRELFYTAVTRARSRVLVVGTPDQVASTIRARKRRMSGLAALLRA